MDQTRSNRYCSNYSITFTCHFIMHALAMYVASEEVVNKLIKYAEIFNVAFKWYVSNVIKGSKLIIVYQCYNMIFVDNHLARS